MEVSTIDFNKVCLYSQKEKICRGGSKGGCPLIRARELDLLD
jgi:hypothetical protein